MAKNPTTDQLLIAYRQGEQAGRQGEQLKIANQSRGANPHDDMTGYGSDWPGTMKDQQQLNKLKDVGKDPAELFEQLELPLGLVKQLQINPQQLLANLKMWPNLEGIGVTIPEDDSEYGEASGPNKKELEEKGWSNLPQMMNQNVAHSPSGTYDADGRPRDKAPWDLIGPDGMPMQIDWLKRDYMDNQHQEREQLHNQKYHQVSDASALTNYLKAIGQNQRTGSMRDSNLKGQELIDALKIGVEKLKA